MSIVRRLNSLEKMVQPLAEKIEREKKECQERKEHFNLLNQIMIESYPEHEWCKLPIEEKLRIYNKPGPLRTYKNTNSLIPIFVPSEEKEDKLYYEVLRLVIDSIRKELSGHREEKYLNSPNL